MILIFIITLKELFLFIWDIYSLYYTSWGIMERCLRYNVKYIPSTKIGEGIQGAVYLDKNGTYVLKIQEIHKDPHTIEMFDREIELQTKAYNLGISPRIIDHWKCDKDEEYEYGVIVTEKLDMTISKYFKKKRRDLDILSVLRTISKAMDILQGVGIYHTDYNFDNIMISKTPNLLKLDLEIGTRYLYIIDFGMAFEDKPEEYDNMTNDYITFAITAQNLLR